jgi:phosphoribosylformylglycinamidine synthase
VPRVVVDVMPKPEILDAQGKAVLGALARLGFPEVSEVRQGKRFELVVGAAAGDAAALQARMEEIAGTLLANPVIETYTVRVEPDDASDPLETKETA